MEGEVEVVAADTEAVADAVEVVGAADDLPRTH
jgi:hypothetical protein